ncbi:alpha/beta fold hydrolase [Rhizobium lusitanum]|jgi:pimeloyl-ACP methyl ester carboxylesterase|uniref:Pimeloyl-ACP methyl ester carboxylesterase n=1 Tax=Rhizobium lusitanum TaxID=293958 RepID=A0A1C3X095_9HYPH|nr:alpha/beta hydrolase [Rhizobium lusitanum]SCB45649.1 Pimeloyl-ACP methyl ester carboxylesterase [Rhizobium lusitanum]
MSSDHTPFTEHRIPRVEGSVYTRDYAGTGPTFVLMHGFPDNQHIWDDLIPHLVASGRRVVTFDFLGFGASDKPAGAAYSFKQQLGDLEAVVEGLGLGKIVPVAHDSSGMATLNYVLTHPDAVDSAIMLNSAYSEDSTFFWPEMITLFATRNIQPLAMAIAQSPEQFGWLLRWQQKKFLDALPEAQKRHFSAFIGSLISNNFIVQPGAGPAFVQLAAEFFDEHARNAKHLAALKALDIPVKLIWGQYDPYFPAAMAERRQSQLKNASLTLIPAGHWLQADEPAQVAKAMLS